MCRLRRRRPGSAARGACAEMTLSGVSLALNPAERHLDRLALTRVSSSMIHSVDQRLRSARAHSALLAGPASRRTTSRSATSPSDRPRRPDLSQKRPAGERAWPPAVGRRARTPTSVDTPSVRPGSPERSRRASRTDTQGHNRRTCLPHTGAPRSTDRSTRRPGTARPHSRRGPLARRGRDARWTTFGKYPSMRKTRNHHHPSGPSLSPLVLTTVIPASRTPGLRARP
jgi:hypothetical protein